MWVSHTDTTPSVSPLSRYLPDLNAHKQKHEWESANTTILAAILTQKKEMKHITLIYNTITDAVSLLLTDRGQSRCAD